MAQRIDKIASELFKDAAYGPALKRFREALEAHVADKHCKDKTSKAFPNYKELHRSLETAGIDVTYSTINNGYFSNKYPQLPPATLNRIADFIEQTALGKTNGKPETLTVTYDAARLGNVSRDELKAVAQKAVEDHIARSTAPKATPS